MRRRPVLLVLAAVELVAALAFSNEIMGFLSNGGVAGYLADAVSAVDLGRFIDWFPG